MYDVNTYIEKNRNKLQRVYNMNDLLAEKVIIQFFFE